MAFRWKSPRNDQSALDGAIGGTIKKRYPRNAQSNRDMRAQSRYTNVDSRFSTVNSAAWGSE